MKIWVLVVGLLLLYMLDPWWRRRKPTATDAFTGVWLAASLVLLFNTSAHEFLTWAGIAVILTIHTSFAFGRTCGRIELRSSVNLLRFIRVRFVGEKCSEGLVYSIFLLLALIGVVGAFVSLGGFDPFRSGTIAENRGALLQGEIQVPFVYRLFSNFMYPVVLVGSFLAVKNSGTIKNIIYIVLPLVCPLIYSFAMGGKGCLLICVSIVGWSLAVQKGIAAIQGKALAMVAGTVSFFAFVTSTRPDQSSGVLDMLNIYIYGPLVAFPQFLSESSLYWFHFDLNGFAIVREFSGLLGLPTEGRIDQTVVLIPERYNVFTAIPEWSNAFGFIGAHAFIFGIGVGSTVANKSGARYELLQVVLFTYLSFSLFADLASLMVGWWLCLFVAIIAIWVQTDKEVSSRLLVSVKPSAL
jgi:oligosaccharide repeat unit polymerase